MLPDLAAASTPQTVTGPDAGCTFAAFVVAPQAVGYQLLTNYESLYWRALVGRDAWSLYETLRTFCHAGDAHCFPSLRLLTAILGLGDTRLLTGYQKTVHGKQYTYPGLLAVLAQHGLLRYQKSDPARGGRYTFSLNLHPGPLTPDQLAALPAPLQHKHAQLLARRYGAAERPLPPTVPPMDPPTVDAGCPLDPIPPVSSTPENAHPHPGKFPGDPPENSRPPRGKLPPKQYPINITQTDKTQITTTPRPQPRAAADPRVVVALTQHGLSSTVAARLAADHRPAHIQQKLSYLAFLQSHDPSRVKNPCGWLRRAIEEDYTTPDGFISDAERERQRAAAAQQAQAQAQRLAAAEQARQAVKEEQEAEEAACRQALATRYGTTEREIHLWQEVLLDLQCQLGAAIFCAYVAGSMLLALDNDQALIGLADPSAKDWVENRLGKRIQELLARQLAGRKVSVQFVGLDGEAQAP